MIDFFKRRKLRKQLKEYLHAARHARHMREDIAKPADLERLIRAEAALKEIRRTGEGEPEPAIERLTEAVESVYPTTADAAIRENVEVIIVALAAAMAIRAFFFQPFKIPTGSMQPSLNGILTEEQVEPTFMDLQPMKFVKWILTGESYKTIRAKASGQIDQDRVYRTRDHYMVLIGGVEHKVPSYMFSLGVLDPDHYYSKGDVIFSGKVIAGDHILVNKMKYNFMRPQRGDVSVFDTKNIQHSEVRENTFYIKRMVGLPGEKIQIQNGRIVADGKVINDPPIFETIATDPLYSGHSNVGELATESAVLPLADDEYLMMGDNTHHSLDGRYFGGVGREDFLGPAFFVYWPFREHWGLVH